MAPDPSPSTIADLTWIGELRFSGQAGDLHLILDSEGRAGPSPVQALAYALAGCMGMDLVHILTKGRHPLTGVQARLAGHRASQDPRRFERIQLHFVICGNVPEAAIERAIALSREKYCSVWHSMRQQTEFTVTFERG